MIWREWSNVANKLWKSILHGLWFFFQGLIFFLIFKVQGNINQLLEEHFPTIFEQASRNPILFGDYRTFMHEGEPRVYEDLQDYEAAKALFQVGRNKNHYTLHESIPFEQLF